MKVLNKTTLKLKAKHETGIIRAKTEATQPLKGKASKNKQKQTVITNNKGKQNGKISWG